MIKVVGVGGCGGNAVDHMIDERRAGRGVHHREHRRAGAEAQPGQDQLQLGANITKGLGAGANPEVGAQAALEDRERIAELIAGADMLFLTAGMGGGTGTGAAPVVAEIARELGILTVAVVTKPFAFEGKRQKVAAGRHRGARAARRLAHRHPQRQADAGARRRGDARRGASAPPNDVLHGAVAGIAEIISCPGMINVDFADVRTVMAEMGMAMMGSAKAAAPTARGWRPSRPSPARCSRTSTSPTRAACWSTSPPSSASLKLQEIYEVMDTIKRVRRRGRDRDRRRGIRRGARRQPARDDRRDRAGQGAATRSSPSRSWSWSPARPAPTTSRWTVDYDAARPAGR